MTFSNPARRVLTCTAVAAATVAAVAATAVPASAAPAAKPKPPVGLHVTYDALGSSTVVKTGSVVALGPTTLNTLIKPDGTFTGNLALPPAPTSFKLLGFVPVKATVTFIPVGGVTGALTGNPTVVTSSATYYIQLSNVTVAGFPAFVGSSCRTAAPVTIALTTPAGQAFDVTSGGTVAGSYTIGSFSNCGLTTGLLNLLIPGPNNPVSLTLSNGRITS